MNSKKILIYSIFLISGFSCVTSVVEAGPPPTLEVTLNFQNNTSNTYTKIKGSGPREIKSNQPIYNYKAKLHYLQQGNLQNISLYVNSSDTSDVPQISINVTPQATIYSVNCRGCTITAAGTNAYNVTFP